MFRTPENLYSNTLKSKASSLNGNHLIREDIENLAMSYLNSRQNPEYMDSGYAINPHSKNNVGFKQKMNSTPFEALTKNEIDFQTRIESLNRRINQYEESDRIDIAKNSNFGFGLNYRDQINETQKSTVISEESEENLEYQQYLINKGLNEVVNIQKNMEHDKENLKTANKKIVEKKVVDKKQDKDEIKKQKKKNKVMKTKDDQKNTEVEFLRLCLVDLANISKALLKSMNTQSHSLLYSSLLDNIEELNPLKSQSIFMVEKIDYIEYWINSFYNNFLANESLTKLESAKKDYTQSQSDLYKNLEEVEILSEQILTTKKEMSGYDSKLCRNLKEDLNGAAIKLQKTKKELDFQKERNQKLEFKVSEQDKIIAKVSDFEKELIDLQEDLKEKNKSIVKLEDEVIDLKESVESERDDIINYLENTFNEVFEVVNTPNNFSEQQFQTKESGYKNVDTFVKKISEKISNFRKFCIEAKRDNQIKAVISDYVEAAEPQLKVLEMLERMTYDIPSTLVYFKESMYNDKLVLLDNLKKYKEILLEDGDNVPLCINNSFLNQVENNFVNIKDKNNQLNDIVETLKNKIENISLENESLRLLNNNNQSFNTRYNQQNHKRNASVKIPKNSRTRKQNQDLLEGDDNSMRNSFENLNKNLRGIGSIVNNEESKYNLELDPSCFMNMIYTQANVIEGMVSQANNR